MCWQFFYDQNVNETTLNCATIGTTNCCHNAVVASRFTEKQSIEYKKFKVVLQASSRH